MKFSIFKFQFSTNIKGQIMLLTVLLLGSIILGATTIAGYLMLQKIQIASDITNSTKAFFAADAGIELALYRKFSNLEYEKPIFSNGATFSVNTSEGDSFILIKSIGTSGRTSRALQFTITFESL